MGILVSITPVLDFATRLDFPPLKVFNINLLSPEIFVSYTTFSMIIGYMVGIILIPRFISQQKALTYSIVIALIMTGMVLVVPVNWSVFMVAALGMVNAMTWPAIWPLSLAGLGKFTKTGSSILVLGIVGGAVIPLIFGWMVDILSFQSAYWINIPCYLYILYFAIRGHKVSRWKISD